MTPAATTPDPPVQTLGLDDLRFLLFETTPSASGDQPGDEDYDPGTDCSHCTIATACVNCTDCTAWTTCSECTRCTNCSGCTNCTSCTVQTLVAH